jgi:plastocyanin domain-containing protein
MMNSFSSFVLAALLCCFAGSSFAETASMAEARLDADGVQRLNVAGGNYYFQPKQIVVRAGVPVELTLKRESAMVPHDFVLRIEADGIDIAQVFTGSGTVVAFTPLTPGKYAFTCSKKLPFFASHLDKGMEGVLVVTP